LPVYKPVSSLSDTSRRCRLLQSPILAGNDPIKTANAELVVYDIPANTNRVTGQATAGQVQLSDVIAQLAHVLRKSETGVSVQRHRTTFALHADD
jgi:hypothetical protein